jgi:hypothetical protein
MTTCHPARVQSGARAGAVVGALDYEPEGELICSVHLTLPVAIGPGVYSDSKGNEYSVGRCARLQAGRSRIRDPMR